MRTDKERLKTHSGHCGMANWKYLKKNLVFLSLWKLSTLDKSLVKCFEVLAEKDISDASKVDTISYYIELFV